MQRITSNCNLRRLQLEQSICSKSFAAHKLLFTKNIEKYVNYQDITLRNQWFLTVIPKVVQKDGIFQNFIEDR